jgi:hypothetical protein
MSLKSIFKSTLRTCIQPNKSVFFNQPIFVVSCGRSGSTALCKGLEKHPRILMAEPEGPLFENIGEMLFEYSNGAISEYYKLSTKLNEEEFRNKIKDLCYQSAFGTDFGLLYNFSNISKKNSILRNAKNLKYWGVKAFPTESSAVGLQWLYPSAKFIYLHRNGLEVVYSMSKFGSFANLTFQDRCKFWSDRVFQYEYLRHNHNSVTIRFDDFLNDPSVEYNKIFEYLSLEPSAGPNDFVTSNFIHPLNMPTQKIKAKEELVKRKSGYLDWSNEEKDIFINVCSKAMKMLNYEIPF